jgi:hypothetical protein
MTHTTPRQGAHDQEQGSTTTAGLRGALPLPRPVSAEASAYRQRNGDPARWSAPMWRVYLGLGGAQ